MREGYSTKRVKDICSKGTSTIAQKDLDGRSGEYPIYGASGFIKKVDFYHQEKECVGLVKDGAGVGRVIFLPPKSSVIGTMQYIIPKDGFDIRYIGYCLQSLGLSKYSQGATIPHIYFKDYGETEIMVPNNIAEQQRIVDVLDAEFSKIDSMKANAEKNLCHARALFISSVEKVFANIESSTMEVSSIAKVSSGYAFKSSDFVPSGRFQVVRIGNVKQNNLRLTASPVYINMEDEGIIAKSELKIGDLVVTQTGTKHKMDYGFVAFVDTDGLLLNQRVARIRFAEQLYAKWFLFFSYTKSYREQFFAHEGGTVGQGNVGINAIGEMRIPIPNRNVMNAMTNNLDILSHHCETLQKNFGATITLCEALKQALLRKAFNGEI